MSFSPLLHNFLSFLTGAQLNAGFQKKIPYGGWLRIAKIKGNLFGALKPQHIPIDNLLRVFWFDITKYLQKLPSGAPLGGTVPARASGAANRTGAMFRSFFADTEIRFKQTGAISDAAFGVGEAYPQHRRSLPRPRVKDFASAPLGRAQTLPILFL
jgi:hypothetical protein